MILRSITLENIRSYKYQKIEFPEGSFLLSGDIGAGKSSILLSIEFALFGIMRSGLSGESLLKYGQTKGSVELAFSVDGKDYVIRRTLKRQKDAVGQESGYLITGDLKFEGTPIELKAKILEILGYPQDMLTKSRSLIYRYTVYTPQEEMKQILYEDKDVRLETLRKVFGIDKYRIIRDNASLFLRELRKKKAELDGKLEILSDVDKEYSQRTLQLESLRTDSTSKAAQMDAVKKRLKEEKESLDTLEEQVKSQAELAKEIEGMEKLVSAKKKQMADLAKQKVDAEASILTLEGELARTPGKPIIPEEPDEAALNELYETYKKVSEENLLAKERIKQAADEIARLTSDLSLLQKKASAIQSQKEKLVRLAEVIDKRPAQTALLEKSYEMEKSCLIDLEKVKQGLKESETKLDLLGKDKCPTCSQDISKEYKDQLGAHEKEKMTFFKEKSMVMQSEKEKISANITRLKENIEKISRHEKAFMEEKALLERMESDASKIDEFKEAIKKVEESRHGLSQALDLKKEEEVKEKYELQKTRLATIRTENKAAIARKNTAERVSLERQRLGQFDMQSATVAAEIDLESGKAEALRKEINPEIRIRYAEKKVQCDRLFEELRKEEILLAGINKHIENTNEDLFKLEKRIAELGRLRDRQKEFQDLIDWIDRFFLNLMTTIEKHVLASIHKEFSLLLKDWFAILIDDIDIMLDDEFSIRIIQDGYESGIENLSGGEKTSVALAYRLALNKVINDLIPSIKTRDFIILDEPTDGFSSQQLDKVREVLDSLNMKQTIIVSHEPKMESYVEKIIRISKSDSESVARP